MSACSDQQVKSEFDATRRVNYIIRIHQARIVSITRFSSTNLLLVESRILMFCQESRKRSVTALVCTEVALLPPRPLKYSSATTNRLLAYS